MVEKQKTYLELNAEIEKLQQLAREMRQKEVEKVIEEIKGKIRSYGITAHDLGFAASSRAKAGKKSLVQAKYRGPNGEEWSGRGLTPKWLREEIAKGKPKENFAIK
jgi:DNA-binding protein H-NS